MANDTVVRYILEADATNAEEGLNSTATAAEKAAVELDKIGKNSKAATDGLKKVESQAKKTEDGLDDVSKAGDDMEGGFRDVAEAVGVLDPKLGQLFDGLSKGAKAIQGVVKGLTVGLNPAFIAIGVAAAGAAAAYAIFSHKQQQAAEDAENMLQKIKDANEVLRQQETILMNTARSYGDFISAINEAQLELDVLQGRVGNVDAQKALATQKAQNMEAQLLAENMEARAAIHKTLTKQELLHLALTEQLNTAQGDARIHLGNQRIEVERQIAATKGLIAENKRQVGEIRKQAEQFKNTQHAIIDANQAIKDGQEAERRRREKQIQNEKDAAKAEKDKADAERKAEEDKKKLQDEENARLEKKQELLDIIETLKFNELSAQEQLNKLREKEIAKVQELAELSGSNIDTANAIVMINRKYDELLDDILEKNIELDNVIKLQKSSTDALTDSLQSLTAFIESPSLQNAIEITTTLEPLQNALEKSFEEQGKKLEKRTEQLKGIFEMFGARDNKASQALIKITDKLSQGATATGAAVAKIGPALSAAITALGAALPVILLAAAQVALTTAIIKGLARVGEKTPQQRRAEMMAQAEAVKQGLEFLPEILLRIIPEFAVALAEAFFDGFALLFNNLSRILVETFNSFFTREGRRERREGRNRLLADFFDPTKSVSFAGGGSFIPSAAGGIRFTGEQRSGLALLHQNEFVVPSSGQRPQAVDREMRSNTNMNIIINSHIVEQSAIDALVQQIEQRFNSNFGLASSNLFGGR